MQQVYLKKIDSNLIIRWIEKEISRWPDATVFVNHHECEFQEPDIAREHKFSSENTEFEGSLGRVELVINQAKAPLEVELQGIDIFSDGHHLETTLAGSERKPFVNYIFGIIDVPKLQTDDSKISPFEMSRSKKLNPNNPLVASIHAFIGIHVEQVRKLLEAEDRERRQAQETKLLEKEADKISQVINSDFNSWRGRIKQSQAKIHGGADVLQNGQANSIEGNDFIFGSDKPAEIIGETFEPGISPESTSTPNPPNVNPSTIPEIEPQEIPQVEIGDKHSSPLGQNSQISKSKKKPSGGFSVDFLNMGEKEARAKYERANRTIFVNLDHPQILASINLGGLEDIAFRRLTYEVAFAEYAIALASEMAATDYYIDATEPIMDIRETLNRVAKNAAGLYSSA